MESKKHTAPYKITLDKEEQELSDSFDRGEWTTVEDFAEMLSKRELKNAI